MQLFENVPRTLRGPSPHAYDHFLFLTRSAQPYASNVRELLELWFSHLPADEQPALQRRFQEDFNAAFFELLIHELLLVGGCSVEHHPVLPSGVATHPDYLAQHQDHPDAYVEVRVSSDKSAAEAAFERMLAQLYDEINRMPLADYSLLLRRVDIPPSQRPSARKFMRHVHEAAAALDYEEVVARAEQGLQALPRIAYREGEAMIEACLMPLRRDRVAGPRMRAIGAFPTKTRWGSSAGALLKTLKRKGPKYGRLSAPFVIAVNSVSEWGTSARDVVNALYGSEAIRWDVETGDDQFVRNPDGFWYGPTGAQNRRVSAALICSVNPYNLHIAGARLYLNPWAEAPYSGPLECLPQTRLIEGVLEDTEGAALGAVLSIPPNWPGEKED